MSCDKKGASGASDTCCPKRSLGHAGEQVYDVPTLTEAEGVELFALRAKDASAEFAVNEKTRPDIVQVVTRLDGISLAIELAAGRMGATTVAELASHLDESLSRTHRQQPRGTIAPPDAARDAGVELPVAGRRRKATVPEFECV